MEENRRRSRRRFDFARSIDRTRTVCPGIPEAHSRARKSLAKHLIRILTRNSEPISVKYRYEAGLYTRPRTERAARVEFRSMRGAAGPCWCGFEGSHSPELANRSTLIRRKSQIEPETSLLSENEREGERLVSTWLLSC